MVRLAIVCLSNICQPTAQSLTGAIVSSNELSKLAKHNSTSTEDVWRQLVPTALVLGQDTITEFDIEFLNDQTQPECGLEFGLKDLGDLVEELTCDAESTFRNRAAITQFEALESCPAPGEDGWTRGAFPQAWWDRQADVEFLKRCPDFIQFAQHLDTEVGLFELQRCDPVDPLRPSVQRSLDVGLPLAHPNEHMQQIFRRQFDHLQITTVIASVQMQRLADRKDAIAKEVARRFVAWSPMSWDPWLSERIGSRTASAMPGKKRKGAYEPWEINAATKGSWNRSWDDCGWI